MDLTEKLTSRCADQNDENAQLQDELTILRSNYDQEKQIRHQLEKQMNEANKLIEMVANSTLQKTQSHRLPFRIILNVYKNYVIMLH